MGKPGYEVTAGTVTLDGVDLLALPTWKRAQAGLFLAMQYPIEVPGVALTAVLEESLVAAGRPTDGLRDALLDESDRIGFDHRFLDRPLNVDLSGGEKKRNETLQLGVLRPRIAVLDEIDSGLDIDALRAVSRRIEEETNERGLGVLAITHYSRLLHELRPDHVHVLIRGRIERSGGPELAMQLESTGYSAFGVGRRARTSRTVADPLGDPLPGRTDLSWRPMRVRIGIACVVAVLVVVAGVVLWPKGGKAATRVEVAAATTHDDHDRPRTTTTTRTAAPRSKRPTPSSPRCKLYDAPGRDGADRARCRTRRSSTCRSPSS